MNGRSLSGHPYKPNPLSYKSESFTDWMKSLRPASFKPHLLTNTNSQSEFITDCLKCSNPTSSGEAIKAESVMENSDYTGVEPKSSLNRCEDIEERRERKTGYLMSREQKDILANMKEEEEDWKRQSVKMEGEDGVRDEEGLWKKEEKQSDEEMEGHVTD
ncbi:hypothetical protein SKAU_G00183350, partial [Synaphobranchus kaupii]